ncbi:hypothetical protein GUJ93_ZPchr0008g11447 [Zizania palustris]|uniref:RWP-RK domain-containing protein n=1 Tax=Zizania palustris TaxID=103762 RepID=A0A8J5RF98_ZIZPA|nr:hypothetical protein GUJ93_ZPchr0008g11447 [Zizania palustris]
MDMQDDCCYGVDDVVHWFQPLAAVSSGPCWWPSPAASSSSSPLLICDHDDVLDAAGVHGELAMGGCCSADLVLREEELPVYMPIPATAAAADDHCMYQRLQADHLISSSPLPVPADDDELLMLPITDIDLDAFVDDELIRASPPSLDAAIVPAPAISGRHSGTLQNAFKDVEVDMSEKHDPARGGSIVYDHDDSLAMVVDAVMVAAGSGSLSGTHLLQNACNDMELDMRQQQDAARGGGAVVHDDSLSMVVAAAYGMGMRSYAAQKQQSTRPEVMALPPPPPHRLRTGSHDGSAPSAGRNRLDHIQFDDLRRYFYMPITRAAREMNVGLTVLKKRCRELGVARWPYRKIKSLKSLIVNVKEMGTKGMSSAAIRRELATLETCFAMIEQNPAVELTQRTKKLRQACFKENYKRRRAAGAADMLDHCFGFSRHHQPLALPLQLPASPTATGAGNHVQCS